MYSNPFTKTPHNINSQKMALNVEDGSSLFNFVVRDGYGVKGLVDLGLSKVPDRYVQPPEERIDKSSAGTLELPPIDLSKLGGPFHEQVVNDIVRAAETLGFFQVINHGVPVELLESLKDAAYSFFGQEPEKKAVFRKGTSPSPFVTYGTSFAPEKETALEWKDYLTMIYTNDDGVYSYWPAQCKEVALEYLRASEDMVQKLLNVLITNLGMTLESSEIIDYLTGMKAVNMNFYPACPNPDLTVGNGRHSDMGTLTVLLQDGIGGLYVKVEENLHSAKKGQWIEIPPTSGALVINIGDTFEIISNGKYKSAEHRVRTTSNQSRVSIPIFIAPKPTQKVGPLPQMVEKDGVAFYREVLFQDYMNNYFRNAHKGKKKSLDYAKITSS